METITQEFKGDDLREKTYSKILFSGCVFINVDFRNCTFDECIFDESCSLKLVDFRDCTFSNTSFTTASITYCDMRDTRHIDTVLTPRQLESLDVRDAIFRLTKEELIDGAVNDAGEPITEVTYQISGSAPLPYTAPEESAYPINMPIV